MEPKFQTSFIPKGPIAAASPLMPMAAVKPKRTLFGLLATFVFIIALLAAIGSFAYERYLLAHIATLGSDLSAAEAQLEPEVVNELVSTNSRINSARALLSRHVALTPLFDWLEGNTLKNIRFTDFAYTTDPQKGIMLTMKGQARSYSDIALQSQTFAQAAFLKNQTFTDLGLDAKGNVTFTYSATVLPTAVSYQKRFEGISAPAASLVATSTATSTPAVATSSPKTVTASSTVKTASSTPH